VLLNILRKRDPVTIAAEVECHHKHVNFLISEPQQMFDTISRHGVVPAWKLAARASRTMTTSSCLSGWASRAPLAKRLLAIFAHQAFCHVATLVRTKLARKASRCPIRGFIARTAVSTRTIHPRKPSGARHALTLGLVWLFATVASYAHATY
jgi:hypothetical protein